MSTETSKLPEKPSELILIALKDLRAAEASEKYDINMGGRYWHFPPKTKDKSYKCEVCLAGSVMAFSLGGDINNHYEPGNFPGEEGKLRSLDVFRTGHVTYGMREFYGNKDTTNYEEITHYFLIPHYPDNRDCLLYTSPSPRDRTRSRMPSSA